MNKALSPGWWYLCTKCCTWGFIPRAQQMAGPIFRWKDWIMYNCFSVLVISFARTAYHTAHRNGISISPGTRGWLQLLVSELRYWSVSCANFFMWHQHHVITLASRYSGQHTSLKRLKLTALINQSIEWSAMSDGQSITSCLSWVRFKSQITFVNICQPIIFHFLHHS